MTEQELLNKLNTVVRVAQEKVITLLTDLHNEQAIAKAKMVFANCPIVLENIDSQKNEFNKSTQVGGYATAEKIVINQHDIQSCNLDIEQELDKILGTIIHEYAHKFRQVDFQYGNMFEEASASIFAEMCVNYSKVKNNDPKNTLFNMLTSVDYQRAESQVRGILYALKQRNMDISMMTEYILGDESRFKQVCTEIFGNSFENYFNQATNIPQSQQHTSMSEELLTQMLTEYMKTNQVSLKDYWASNKGIASPTNLYFHGSPTLCKSVVNAGKEIVRDDEKELFSYFEYSVKVNQEQTQFVEDEKRTRIKNKINQDYGLSGKSKDDIYDTLVDLCSSYIQHKSRDDEESVFFLEELKKVIPNIDEFADTFIQLRIARLDSTVLDNIDLSNISYNQIFSQMSSLLPKPQNESTEQKDYIATKDINEVARIHSNPQYMNWRYEFVDGEYRFYSPNYKKQETITFYHGGAEPDFDITKLDVLRSSQKQQNSSNSYAGFYMYGEQNHDDAIKYAQQENSLKNTSTKGVVKITMPSDLKVYTVPPFSITRITKDQIRQLQQQGYDLIAGSMLGKTEYVLLNKDKIINMEFQTVDMKNELAKETTTIPTEKEEETYVTLEQLEPLLSESGYMCFGHGTGRKGNSDEVVDSIFSEGLRTKNNSLYYTTIGLTTPTPENKELMSEIGMPEPTIENLKNQFNNWQHQDSKKIIIARVPTEYINTIGERSDLDGEMYGAFYIQELQPNGQETNYLDPKFIVGCFDVEKQAVRLNKKYERTLSPETIKRLKENYKKTLEKTKARLDRAELGITQQEQVQEMVQQEMVPDYSSYDSFDFPEIEWDDTPSVGKTR